MVKIGIEVPDEKFSNVDMSRPDLGNPGIGGSEYLFSLLGMQLYERNENVTLFHYSQNKMADVNAAMIVTDSIDLIKQARYCGIDILIHQVGKTKEWYEELEKTCIKSIAWAHVYLDYYELQLLRKSKSVKRVVFVGKEEYDAYIDDDVIEKASYIYNMIPIIDVSKRNIELKPIVTYVGSLVHAKGFHKLAEIWPEVLKRIPDAQLYVIGSGKVYRRDAKLGKYGIAQEDYEESFIRYLLDKDGKIHHSVHFMGIVGTEKTDIFKDTKVGIVNPTALTETFCMSAVEMEYAYIPVVSRKKWGLLDTIIDGYSGFLFSNKKEFINRVEVLLNDSDLNAEMGLNAHRFARETFSVESIVPQWLILINNVNNDLPVVYQKVLGNWYNDFKFVKQFIRFFRFNVGLKFLPSFYDLKHCLKIILGKE